MDKNNPWRLRPFFKYAGGKWASAHRYPKPQMRTLVEPFAGSAGYATTYADRNVILVDQDERIVGTWEWLIKATARDILALPILEQGQTVDDIPGLPQEARWYLGYRINIGASPGKTATRWQMWTPEVRDVIARQIHRINHWRVVHGRYDSVNEYATYFIDPPYQLKSFYRERVDDYAELRRWIEGLHGQVIVCEGEGADWLPFRQLFEVKTHVNAERSHVGELLYYRCQ